MTSVKIQHARPPKSIGELKAQLLQSIDQLDRGKGKDGEQVIRRLRKRIRKSDLTAKNA